MSTFFLSTIVGAPFGPASLVGVTEGTVTVAAAAINVKIDTTIAPNLSYSDTIAMLQSCLNYIETDSSLTKANRVLGLVVP